MKINFGSTILRINISFAVAVTLTLIIDESGLCAAALFCCAVHELGHIVSLVLLGEKPYLIELSFYGVRLERKNEKLNSYEEIIVYASGPAANFILSAFLFMLGKYEGLRIAAAASLCVGLFNLLPCVPLDGGNLLACFLQRFTDEQKSEKICRCVSCVAIVPMIIAGVYFLVKKGNVTLISVSLYLAVMIFLDKKHRFFYNNML